MKTITCYLILVLTLITFSCKENTSKEQTNEEPQVALETVEMSEETEEEFDDPILLGEKSRKDIEVAPYSRWFTPTYEEYKVDTATTKEVATQLSDTQITVFMGTWCEDSQREAPGFLKILDASDYDMSNFQLITVSEEKDTPEGLEEGLNITNVPTIIFSVDNKELGRIVEFPIESLEKDMAKILKGEDYKHAYEE